MGTCTQVYTGYGKSAREVFDRLSAEAEAEYGWDIYNGQINNCYGFSMGTLDQKSFTPKAINRWIDTAMEELYKHECVCLELPRSFAKGQPRGYRKYIFVAACPE
jgi:hypothetical protein